MTYYPLRYMPSGFIFMDSEDDCDKVVDAMLETNYSEEFCLAPFDTDEQDLNEEFIRRLMGSGFLVMSAGLIDNSKQNGKDAGTGLLPDPFCILLPKLHLVRSVLFFPELHIKKSIRRFISRYELRVNTDFDFILDKCIQIHGEDWLTAPLVEILKRMRTNESNQNVLSAKPVSFAVYREGELKAGEIGVVMGQVYTSYSGYYEEDNAGTVQMILMTQWLEKAGFAFLDFGMPMDYKTALGARNISPRQFVELFRAARC